MSAQVKKQEARAELATTSSLSSYVATLPEEQLRLLTSDMSPEVKEAMQMVVKYIFKVKAWGAIYLHRVLGIAGAEGSASISLMRPSRRIAGRA
eukprot:scaffold154615_cov34-Tisochrysis_lutea.AAC.2